MRYFVFPFCKHSKRQINRFVIGKQYKLLDIKLQTQRVNVEVWAKESSTTIIMQIHFKKLKEM